VLPRPDEVPEPTREVPYTVVSSDSHAGPSLRHTLRPYCPQAYLNAFDEYERMQRSLLGTMQYFGDTEKFSLTLSCKGHDDPVARLRDMDDSGIAAEVIFAGGQNHQGVPFLGSGFDAGRSGTATELRQVGERMWNEWLSDFVATAPSRLVGVMQVPLWDVELAVKEIASFHDRGLKAVNFPSPRADFLAYNDPAYDPVWAMCSERGIPLVSHSGGGEKSLGADGPGGTAILMAETWWLCRRHLPQLIFGGVFERYPELKVVFTEQRVRWVADTLEEYDSLYFSDIADPALKASVGTRPPSDYFHQNCFIGASFLAPFEVALRHEVGLHNLMWGDDYPHVEGTWPSTLLSLRDTFAEVPEGDARLILGDNAIEVYGLDRDSLGSVARGIGPLPSQVGIPVDPTELPDHLGTTFRRRAAWS
jgi:predicted TIM-barrel fold metal-dependent hydrolase